MCGPPPTRRSSRATPIRNSFLNTVDAEFTAITAAVVTVAAVAAATRYPGTIGELIRNCLGYLVTRSA